MVLLLSCVDRRRGGIVALKDEEKSLCESVEESQSMTDQNMIKGEFNLLMNHVGEKHFYRTVSYSG